MDRAYWVRTLVVLGIAAMLTGCVADPDYPAYHYSSGGYVGVGGGWHDGGGWHH